MGQWKLLLGSKIESVKDIKTQTSSKVETYSIATSDDRQFMLHKYRITNDVEKSDVEIDGILYAKVGNSGRYHTTFSEIIKCYLKEMQLSPTEDIKNVNDVLKLYEGVIEEGKRLFGLGNVDNVELKGKKGGK